MGQAPLETARARSANPSLMGFTLVELLISISVLMVLTGTVLASYRGYNNNAYFANASEDIVLALRQAQVYGVGVKGQSSSFQIPYGVYFDNSPSNNNKMILFADTFPSTPDGKYTSDDTLIETILWKAPIGITKLECGTGIPCTGNIVSVTFKRPNPDASIIQGGDTSVGTQTGEITIENGASGGSLKKSKVIVTKAGQIYLQ